METFSGNWIVETSIVKWKPPIVMCSGNLHCKVETSAAIVEISPELYSGNLCYIIETQDNFLVTIFWTPPLMIFMPAFTME